MNILVLGGSGTLGSFIKKNSFFNKAYFPKKKKLNIKSELSLKNFIEKKNVKIIVNCAAIARMSKCEKDKKLAMKINVKGPENIVKAIKDINKNIILVHISSDAVYPSKHGHYKENTKLKPYNFYGKTKVLAEKKVKKLSKYMILRTRFFNKKKILFNHSATDSYSSSLEVNTLVKYIVLLIKKNFYGTINIGGRRTSDYNLYKKYKKNLKKCKRDDIQKKLKFEISKDASMDCSLLKKVLNAKF